MGNLADSFRADKSLGMDGKCQRFKAAQQRGGWGIEEFVSHAIHPRMASSTRSLPATITHNSLERHAVPGPTPGGDKDIRIHSPHFFGGSLLPRVRQELPSGGLN